MRARLGSGAGVARHLALPPLTRHRNPLRPLYAVEARKQPGQVLVARQAQRLQSGADGVEVDRLAAL